MRKMRSAKEVAIQVMDLVINRAQNDLVASDEVRRGRPELTAEETADRAADKIIIYAHIEMIDELLQHVVYGSRLFKILTEQRAEEKAKVKQ